MLAASTPASDPNVTGVGGTELSANLTTGRYFSEMAWNEPRFGLALTKKAVNQAEDLQGMRAGMARAAEAVDSGAAADVLRRWVEATASV